MQDVYFQFFSGQVYFEPRLPCDPAQISRFCQMLGEAGRKAGGYAHAKQFKRLRGVLKRQRTILGRLLREVRRKMAGRADDARTWLDAWVQRAERIYQQRRKDKNKLYVLHAPEAEYIGKVKARQSY